MAPKKDSIAALQPPNTKARSMRGTRLSALESVSKSQEGTFKSTPNSSQHAKSPSRNAKGAAPLAAVAKKPPIRLNLKRRGPKIDATLVVSNSDPIEAGRPHNLDAPWTPTAKAPCDRELPVVSGLTTPGNGFEHRRWEHEDDDVQFHDPTSFRPCKRLAAGSTTSALDRKFMKDGHIMQTRAGKCGEYQRKGHFRFEDLPRELRDSIQDYALSQYRKIPLDALPRKGEFPMLQISRQTRLECKERMRDCSSQDPCSVVVKVTDFDFDEAIKAVQTYLGPGAKKKSIPSDGLLPKVLVAISSTDKILAEDMESLSARIIHWFKFLAIFEKESDSKIIKEQCGYEIVDLKEPELVLNLVQEVAEDMGNARQCQILVDSVETWLNRRDDYFDGTSYSFGLHWIDPDYDSQDDSDYESEDEDDGSALEDMWGRDAKVGSEEPSLDSLADLDKGLPQDRDDYLYFRHHEMHLEEAMGKGLVK